MEEFEIHLVYELLETLDAGRVMIDVGANLGMSLWRFAGNEYEVHAFEPNPRIRAQLDRFVKGHPNVHVDGRAVTDRDGDELPLYTGASLGTSTLSPFLAAHRPTSVVRTVTLAAYCVEHSIDEVDFLKVDAEGYDLMVLKGVPWERTSPRVVLIEFQNAVTQRLGYGFHDVASYLSERGYRLLVSEWYPIDGPLGRRAMWRRFTKYPCELLDQDAWGNFIAVRDDAAFERLAFAARIAGEFVIGSDDPADGPSANEAAIARKIATAQEQIGLIGVYMAQYSGR